MEDNNQTIIITGASGFIGRHLVEDLKNDYRIFGIARRSQQESNIAINPNIAWIRTDISDYENTSKAFREISTAGGADFLIHLAAYYDFSGKNNPQYITTNVEGTKNILELSKNLNLKLFIFASSVAACSFPKKGEVIDENSPPDADHYYALSKREGERMMREISNVIPSCIIRFAAVYSDWCEYPPLYMFLNTWLGKSLRRNFLAGRGNSAVPYIHIRDIVAFFRRLLASYNKLKPAEVVIASPTGFTTHKTLYTLANRYFYGKTKKSINMPRIICGLGLQSMNIWGYITRIPPFERPWMYHYIDLQLNVENKKTCSLLNWTPLQRHFIENRMAYLVERLKSEPYTWHARNEAALQRYTIRPELHIYTVLATDEDTIVSEAMKQILTSAGHGQHRQILRTDKSDLFWFIKLIYRLLLTSIHNSNKLLIHNYFELLSINRFEAGFTSDDIIFILNQLNDIIIKYLIQLERIKSFKQELYDLISMPLEFAIDEIDYQYEIYLKGGFDKSIQVEPLIAKELKDARSQLEETIWNCLVHRK
jgi:nucleoside-diphosphate-sugar epimerase